MKPVQCKMARAALSWSTIELSQQADVGQNTVNRYETGGDVRVSSVEKMRAALEAAGATFLDANEKGLGVRVPEKVLK
jgi:transcriptional regulator with XRE-family HTH domain